eukprot:9508877-Alexandrium_andersonii.AAC.1
MRQVRPPALSLLRALAGRQGASGRAWAPWLDPRSTRFTIAGGGFNPTWRGRAGPARARKTIKHVPVGPGGSLM